MDILIHRVVRDCAISALTSCRVRVVIDHFNAYRLYSQWLNSVIYSATYYNIQRHFLATTNNDLSALIAFRTELVHLSETKRGTEIREICPSVCE